MGVVHHANYLRYFELSRVKWLGEHDQPYTAWIEHGLHLAVTRAEVDYVQAARFDDELVVTVWLDWLRRARLRMAYTITRGAELLIEGATEHCAVDATSGRARRIPRDRLEALRARAPKAVSAEGPQQPAQ